MKPNHSLYTSSAARTRSGANLTIYRPGYRCPTRKWRSVRRLRAPSRHTAETRLVALTTSPSCSAGSGCSRLGFKLRLPRKPALIPMSPAHLAPLAHQVRKSPPVQTRLLSVPMGLPGLPGHQVPPAHIRPFPGENGINASKGSVASEGRLASTKSKGSELHKAPPMRHRELFDRRVPPGATAPIAFLAPFTSMAIRVLRVPSGATTSQPEPPSIARAGLVSCLFPT